MTVLAGGRRPYVIGEAGSCHEESLERAILLTKAAAEAGCSAVKFQYWSHPKAMQLRRHVDDPAAYVKGSIKRDWFDVLNPLTHTLGMDFICSVYLPDDVPFVAAHVDALKVASFECQDLDLIRACLEWVDLSVFISTGMQSYWDLAYSSRIVTLHCVSAYPCPPEQANLGAIVKGGGYSDHTRVACVGALAVAAGADYLEVHFRLDDTSPDCPDYPVALTPGELKDYIRFAQIAHLLRGSGRKEPQECEKENMKHLVKSSN